jgi:hypothetical protein
VKPFYLSNCSTFQVHKSHRYATAVDMLREDAEQAEAEATLCLDRERMLALEVSELQRQRDEFRKQLEEAEVRGRLQTLNPSSEIQLTHSLKAHGCSP